MNYGSIRACLESQYLADSRPWVVGFSGGKDSTCVLQFVYEMLLNLPSNKRTKPVHVLSSDTMVEAPIVGIRQRRICKMINASAEKDGIPLKVDLLRPEITDTFWVNIIGRGYPSPNRWFRWCTDRLKIKPMNQFILQNIKRNGEVLILLGARKSESVSRSQTMAKHKIENSNLRKHGSINGAFVFTPIENLSEKEVWRYLDENSSPWGDDNSELKSMYQKKDDEEISFIIDDKSPPSGHSRFGCWTCTVVDEDKALMSLIEDGHPEYVPLLEFRNKLKRIRDDPDYREKYRKNQRTEKFISEFSGVELDRETHRNFEVMGPFTIKTRHDLLDELLSIQSEFQKKVPDIDLITPEEIKAIRMMWIYEGDFNDSFEKLSPEDNINELIGRLLKVEEDMSDISKRVGIYNKLEKAILEYTMNDMVRDGKSKGEMMIDDN